MYGIDLKFLLSVVLNGSYFSVDVKNNTSYSNFGATSIWTSKHFTLKKNTRLTPFLLTLTNHALWQVGLESKIMSVALNPDPMTQKKK